MLRNASTRFGNHGAAWTTPITGTARPSSFTVLPTTSGSAPKCVFQNCSVSTATGGTPGPSSLCFVSRPGIGDTHIVSKKLRVTGPTLIRIALSPSSVNEKGEYSAIAPND